MKVEFTVRGRPPKKQGEKSMWSRDDEAPLVALLREKAFEARAKLGLSAPFRSLTALELTVFAPRSKLESVGDLDSFIAGVCDGLQKADSQALPYLHKVFKEPGRERINPKNELLLDNDAKIVSITASKVSLAEDREKYYKVTIEPVEAVP